MSKIKSRFKQFLSEIYTVRLCKKKKNRFKSWVKIWCWIKSKWGNEKWEMRNEKWEVTNEKWEMRNEEMRKWEIRNEKWEMRNEKWENIFHLVMYNIKVNYFYMSFPAGKSWSPGRPEDVPSNVPRTSLKDSIWPCWGRPNLASQSDVLGTSRNDVQGTS